MYRDDINSAWKWVTNETVDYFNWDDGEPNFTYEHYVHMYRSIHTLGTWNNTENYVEGSFPYSTVNAGFICEWEESESSVVVENRMMHYALFSKSDTTNFGFSGWKSNINGNVYTGASFQYNGSELYITGRVDAVYKISKV